MIADGDVDERDIREVSSDDLQGYNQVHLFAGIGGWSFALRLAGWPDDREVWTGSCPCQPFSQVGARRGTRDRRHLWPQMRRLLRDGRPPVCFGEQVASKAGREWLARVRADLEALGYAAGAADLCAAGAGAPHIRQRLWWVAAAMPTGRTQGRSESKNGSTAAGGSLGRLGIARRQRLQGQQSAGTAARPIDGTCVVVRMADGDGDRCESRAMLKSTHCLSAGGGFWSAFDLVACADGKVRRIEPGTFPLADGIPARVGRLRGYGNAIVPQIAAEFIAAFVEAREMNPKATARGICG